MKKYFKKSGFATTFILSIAALTVLCCDSSTSEKQLKTYDASEYVVDHNSTELSSTQLEAAAAVKIYLEHASVGGNISQGLDSIETSDSIYDRTNFVFLSRGNPGWQEKIDDFYTNITSDNPTASDYDALTMKYCYVDSAAEFEYYRDKMLALEEQYPDTVFVWWTMPIMTTGSDARDSFNHSVRSYCSDNNKILFDIADIESHSPEGVKQTDSNGYEIMYASYSSDGGHLNAEGAERVAMAFWQLAFLISGL